MVIKDDVVYDNILISRTGAYCDIEEAYSINLYDSPIYEILNISKEFGFLDMCKTFVDCMSLYSCSYSQ